MLWSRCQKLGRGNSVGLSRHRRPGWPAGRWTESEVRHVEDSGEPQVEQGMVTVHPTRQGVPEPSVDLVIVTVDPGGVVATPPADRAHRVVDPAPVDRLIAVPGGVVHDRVAITARALLDGMQRTGALQSA